jgi:acyl carrier protein
MTRAEIEAKVLDIIRKEKPIDEASMTRESALADAGIDSLDALTILFAVEEAFDIHIPDQDARSIKTFGDMVDAVQRIVEKP